MKEIFETNSEGNVLVIKLPEDEKLVEALRIKFEEYEKRFEKAKAQGKPFESVMYKRALLGTLLNNSEVDIESIQAQLSELHGGINERDFENAKKVIIDYVGTGGHFNTGGTGLKSE